MLFGLSLSTPSAAGAVGSPPARHQPSMATDPTTGNLVLFGGRAGTIFNDTWTWNGTTWKRQVPPVSPSPRYGAAMAADPLTGTIVLFGGDNRSVGGTMGDTWTWNGTTKTWTQQSPGISPSPRYDAAMAFDPVTGTVVLFGGTPRLGSVDDAPADTWTWNGITKTWTLQNPASSPSTRFRPAMASDAVSGAVLLFGGERCDGCNFLDDTWTWNGQARNWIRQTPPRSPSARGYAYMAEHTATKQIILFGGANPNRLNDTWAWDGQAKTWTKQKPLNRPCARAGGSMAYHGASTSTVIFGGSGPPNNACPGVVEPDTWAWNGVNWKRRA